MEIKTLVLCATVVTAVLCGADASRAEDQVSVADVLAMMDTMPSAPGNPRATVYHWSRKQGAAPIARAIATAAPDRKWAARMVVYAVHESALSTECVAGDGGVSLGTFQLQGVPHAVACNPLQAAPVWLARAQQSIADCSALPAYERLAELVSGSCGRGRRLARLRETLVLRALARALPPPSSPSIE